MGGQIGKSYHQRRYGYSKLYVALSKDGKLLGSEIAYSKKDAAYAFRKRDIKPARIDLS